MLNMTLPAPTRRTMLMGLLGGGAITALASLRGWRERSNRGSTQTKQFAGKKLPLPQASFEQWASEIGSVFYAGTEAGPLILKLVAVTALPVLGARPAGLRKQPFDVRFELQGKTLAPGGDRQYLLRNDDHPLFKLYFSPVGKTLRASFN